MSWSSDGEWAQEMFGACQLGDQRRTDRAVVMAQRVAENPSASFPSQFGTWAELKAAYRLFDSPQVTFDGLATPHWQQTRDRAAGRTLVICDTTELNFGYGRQVDGLGPTGNGFGQGFLLHNALMVQQETGSILGIGGQTIHYRSEKKKSRRKESRSQKLKRQRESEVWGRVIDQVGAPQPGAEYVYVCDRGADNFEVFCHLLQNESHWVLRAKAKNRKLLSSEGETITLGQMLPTLESSGSYELKLRARPGQAARTATIEVTCGKAFIPTPSQQSPWIKSLELEPIATNVVRVREVNADAGVTPIEWVLYTSLSIATFDDVWAIIESYEQRWLIEEFHKALKSGCRVTGRQLKSADRLEPMAALFSVVAVRLLQLKAIAKQEPDRPARTVVPPLWLQMLKAVQKKLQRTHDLTIYDFYRELAKLGGFLGRKSDGEPGWITIWRGWEKLNTLVKGAELALESKLRPERCG